MLSSNKELNLKSINTREKISIIITTIIISYNHEKYIEKAIESAVQQQGYFIHEILISDDFSSDNTQQIINKYEKKYPKLIKNIPNKKTLGISNNMKKCFELANGKYIAILEGDDYWTDNRKLEKQMNFLEQNKDCSMCFSRVNILGISGKTTLLDIQDNLP
ncbi:MAG: glycosyltransferase family 2 protein, partial [Elusimicrobia bacterium]|nr:glycosyltransferase family 2 protein [Elusimicrobiota bacterium]